MAPRPREGDRQGTFYAQSWALTHYLVVADDARRERLAEFFRLLNQGKEQAEAFRAAFGIAVGSLQKKLEAYIRHRSFDYYWFESGEAAVTPKELQGGHDEAAGHFQKAIETDAADPRAPARYGWALVRQFLESQGTDPEPRETTPPLFLKARELFRRSLALDPDHPESLAGFGKTFLFEKGDLQEALQALRRAYKQMPSRTDILHDLIVLLANADQVAEARSLLDRVLEGRAGERDLIRSAEGAILGAEFRQATGLLEQGREEEAIKMLKQAAEGTRDPGLRQEVEATLEKLLRVVRHNRLVARYNEAVQHANAGQLEKAAKALEDLLASNPDEPMRQQAEELLGSLKEILEDRQARARRRP